MQARLLASAVAIGAIVAAGPASAATLAVLSGDSTITMVDTETWQATGSMDVSGIEGRLLGIDVRPADGMLYGVTDAGSVVTIDETGAAKEAGKLDVAIADGAVATVDFNPVADAIRIMGSDGTNLRAKIEAGTVTEDGKHAFDSADMHNGETPNIVAGAYTNSAKGAESTPPSTISTPPLAD
jgi:hypothetical protein